MKENKEKNGVIFSGGLRQKKVKKWVNFPLVVFYRKLLVVVEWCKSQFP